jgi:hypothetical protein
MLQQVLASSDQQVLALRLIRAGITAILFVIFADIIVAIICAVVAKAKGYSAILFAILGLFFSIITLIMVVVIPRRG